MSDNYVSVLLEEIRAQNSALLEGQKILLGLPEKVDKLDKNMSEVKTDVKVIKAAVKDTNKQVHNHEKRVIRLERSVA